jgi:hypothetical protein
MMKVFIHNTTYTMGSGGGIVLLRLGVEGIDIDGGFLVFGILLWELFDFGGLSGSDMYNSGKICYMGMTMNGDGKFCAFCRYM